MIENYILWKIMLYNNIYIFFIIEHNSVCSKEYITMATNCKKIEHNSLQVLQDIVTTVVSRIRRVWPTSQKPHPNNNAL